MREVKDLSSLTSYGMLEDVLQCHDRFFDAENVRDIHENYSTIAKQSFIASILGNRGTVNYDRDNSEMPHVKSRQSYDSEDGLFFPGAYLEEQREYSELTCVTNSLWLPRVNTNYVKIDNVLVGNFRPPIKRMLFEAMEFDLIDPGEGENHRLGRIPAVLVYRSSEEYDDEMTRALSQVLSSSPADTFHVEFQAMDPDYEIRYSGRGKRNRKLLILGIERNTDHENDAPTSPQGKLVHAS